MSARSRIEWTDATWNPVTGCTKIGPGCKNCYAERMARRLKAMRQPRYHNGFRVTCHPEVLDEPLHWKRPKRIFVCSMGDLFHEEVPFKFISLCFDTMRQTPRHTYQLLTKRPERMQKYIETCGFVDKCFHTHIWMGITVEDAAHKWRMENLRRVPAPIRFVSFEPLLESVGELDLRGISWVIVGGETGKNARPMEPRWVREIWEQCQATPTAKVPFFFKQRGSAFNGGQVHKLGGRPWEEWREFPSPQTLGGRQP